MIAKNFLLPVLLAIAVCASFSCRKNSDDSHKPFTVSLPGTWEIRGMGGPLIDIDPNSIKPGNGNTWSFSDSLFEQRSKDTVYKTGTYTTDNSGLSPYENKPVKRFIFNGVPSESFEFRHDSLFVYSTQTDEFQYTAVYVKINLIY